ncbi:MAG: hypothetical protein NW208_08655 [Bryobacter sp.]|nr:hypothetical protein [Bryobacter sp.]
MKTLLLMSAFTLLLAALPAEAQWGYGRGGYGNRGYGPRFAPPPPPRAAFAYGRCPSPRHVYVPGYYQWRGNRYRWVDGRWAVPPRARAVWVPGYWRPQNGVHIWINGFWR